MLTIKIAPDLSEFSRTGNTIRVRFNGLDIRYHMDEDYQPTETCYMWLRAAIVMCSRTWQVERYMQSSPLKGRLEVTNIEEE